MRNPTISTRIHLHHTHLHINHINISTWQSTWLNCLGHVYLSLSSLRYTPPLSPIFLAAQCSLLYIKSSPPEPVFQRRVTSDRGMRPIRGQETFASMCLYQSTCNLRHCCYYAKMSHSYWVTLFRNNHNKIEVILRHTRYLDIEILPMVACKAKNRHIQVL